MSIQAARAVLLILSVGGLLGGCDAWRVSGQQGDERRTVLLVQPAWRSVAESERVRDEVRVNFAEAGHDGRRIDVATHALDLHAPDQSAAMTALARALELMRPALVMTETMGAAHAVRRLDAAVPVVFSGTADPVLMCLVESELRPGGKITGWTSHMPIEAKLVETLRDAYPGLRRVTVLVHADVTANSYDCERDRARQVRAQREEARGCRTGLTRDLAAVELALDARAYLAAAQELGLVLDFLRLCTWPDGEQLLNAWAADTTTGLVVPDQLLMHQNAPALIEAIQRRGIAAVYDGRRYAQEGAVLSVARSKEKRRMRAASELALQVLAGASPAELPVRTPDGLEVIVNVRAAAQYAQLRPSIHLVRRADELLR